MQRDLGVPLRCNYLAATTYTYFVCGHHIIYMVYMMPPHKVIIVLIVRLFLGISQSFVPQIVFTKPEIYILFSIFWTVRKSTTAPDELKVWISYEGEIVYHMQVLVAF